MQSAHEQFTIKAAGFEGPLDVLLDLIEKRKLLINDVSLTTVADEYIRYVANLPELPLGQTADFVALAATLLLLKSRSLLPSLELTEGEEHDVETLKLRLALHQLMKHAALELGRAQWSYAYPGQDRAPAPVFAPHSSMTIPAALQALRELISSFPAHTALPKTVVRTVVSIEEMIDRLTERVQKQMKLSFKEFAGKKAARADVIVSFLALLELVKQGIIRAHQSEDFGDITLESDDVATPSYE